MQLPKQFLEEIRARVPLSDIVGKRVKLTRAGREHKGCCPFHKEKTPSFTVNDVKGFYHCFGCGAHGDVIGFVMNHDNLPFMDAVQQLAALAGLQVPKPTIAEQKQFERQLSLYDLCESAAKYYEACLHAKENKKILQYLLERGLSLETIKSFRVGFAPADDILLKQKLKNDKYSHEDMIESALFRASEKVRGDIYPFFRGRVMFPVQDLQGRVVAFGGRVLPESYGGPPDKSAPKYINSAESPVFHKGRMLYGLSRARRPLGDGATAVVVEGYMDVIALVQAGFLGAVAPLGTALTESQIEELWKALPEGQKTPVLCFDGDAAGQRAAARALERSLPILKPDYSIKFAFLPPQHDPDSLIKAEGSKAMQTVLERSIGIFDMLWQEEAKGRILDQPEAKAGFRAALEKRARAIAHSGVQEFFVHEINQRINDVFLNKNIKQGHAGFQGRSNAAKPRGGKFAPPHPAHMPYRTAETKVQPVRTSRALLEKALIAAIINYPALFEDFAEDLGMIHTPHGDYDRLRLALIDFLSAQDPQIYLDDQAVKQHLKGLGFGQTLESLFDRSLLTQAGFVKPGQPTDIVREAWRDAYARGVAQKRWQKA
jgi:DNA primase